MTVGNRTYEGMAVPLKGESKIEQETAANDILTIDGAASQAGDFIVCRDSDGAEKFVVDKDGGITGSTIGGGSATAIAATGAIPVTTLYSSLDSSGGALAMTLADGSAAGQMKIIKCDTAGYNAVITPAHFKDGTTITMATANQAVGLVFDGTNWCLFSNMGTVSVA